jgi:hypothetical protein
VLITYEDGDARDSIRGEIINPADTAYGSYLEWSAEGDIRIFEIYDANKPVTYRVQWNAVDESGYLMDVGSGDKLCWDTKENKHQDIPCQ